MALDFARQFRLQPEEALAALLLTASHSLGESLQIELPHIDVAPPFNLLAITQETHPVWTGVPLRFLGSGIEKRVEQQLLLRRAEEQTGKKDDVFHKAVLTEQWLKTVHEAAGQQMLRRIADTVVSDQLQVPFASPPIDRAVSLTTPRRGLLRALSELSPLKLVALEDSLLGVRHFRHDGLPQNPPGRPSFFWQIPEAEAEPLFRQHGQLLRHIPFVLLHCREPGFPCLDADAPAVKEFHRLSEILFRERHARSWAPQVHRLDAKVGKVVMRFVEDASRHRSKTGEPKTFQWVADLGLKFALVLMRLENAAKPDLRLVESGLELAKFYARRRHELLSAFDLGRSADSAETADLDDRERRAFLKICESGGITKADLRKSFHKMTSSDRDAIVAKLFELRLIRAEGGLLKRIAA
ncbi:MAG: hypothetical protein KDM63_01665 [Verrucomicrobiae bacterium]|nr:hypothetical protein [Verrucomicrobiae bacterium]MCB1091938.1 hypothetical protein [Verrucomicrobiae bacterium]